ncbi:unnamed protein product [Phytophthora fragariaefolia]|uniref:Unnamed protein product n=1 Tax=Phytophthora fragariaefolia TaxID=1490495 RepID=A0A9W6XL39_9STRA|nr:unnamed protein product [Phytophthora fragariaefolia]
MSGTTTINRRGLMIVDINRNYLSSHPSTELLVDRHHTTVTSMTRHPNLVINVDHHLGVDIRRHVGRRIARHHEDALVHEEDNTISMAVATLMSNVVGHVIVMVIDHHIEGTLLEAPTVPKEVDTKDPNPGGKQTENVDTLHMCKPHRNPSPRLTHVQRHWLVRDVQASRVHHGDCCKPTPHSRKRNGTLPGEECHQCGALSGAHGRELCASCST